MADAAIDANQSLLENIDVDWRFINEARVRRHLLMPWY
jgi:hypothetical protein